ncbi:NUDIX hydrolase [Salinimicrobium marinum]|uniref:NUDIX hydrolase n=1 Tax=Salinimicrobium marinum TaxID=680283 RepID=A0A918SCT3_9FLAO|nr:NUDIX hydrolase [Salinimicrobium marinum]GHA32178.1 NUDIX hydrolase [Salinimicrobium marinum]
MSRQNISLTADSVIFCTSGESIKILLVQRKYDPYKGLWALPGGFLEDEEPLEDGAKRELEEETGLQVDDLKQLRAYGTPGRDPRGRTVSVGFWTVILSEEKVKGSDDAALAEWHDIENLPALAFDHDLIVKEALQRLKF